MRRQVTQVPDGTLSGGLPDMLVALGSFSGVATAVASVVVVWLRQRTGSVSIHIRRPDGSQLEFTADRVRSMDGDGLRAQVDQLASLLNADPDGT